MQNLKGNKIMHRKISIIFGVSIFMLILACAYMGQTSTSKNTNNSSSNIMKEEYGEIIYKGKLPMPIENFIKVTSNFGYRDPVYNSQGVQISGGEHLGIDLCGNIGSKVLCVQDGEVTHSGWQNSYGNCVEIKHLDEEGNVFYSFYAHMRDNSIQVIKGQQVTVGQILGTQGSTGNSTGDHLHFEIRKSSGSNRIDPAPYLFTEK